MMFACRYLIFVFVAYMAVCCLGAQSAPTGNDTNDGPGESQRYRRKLEGAFGHI